MGKLTFGKWGRRIKIWWEGGSAGGIFPGGGNEQIFSWWEGPPPSFLVGKPIYIYIYTLVPACVLITLANLNPALFSVPRGTEKLNKLP